MRRRTLAFAVAALVAVTPLGAAACGGGSGDVQRQQERIDALSSRIASLESELSELDRAVPTTTAPTSSSSSSSSSLSGS